MRDDASSMILTHENPGRGRFLKEEIIISYKESSRAPQPTHQPRSQKQSSPTPTYHPGGAIQGQNWILAGGGVESKKPKGPGHDWTKSGSQVLEQDINTLFSPKKMSTCKYIHTCIKMPRHARMQHTFSTKRTSCRLSCFTPNRKPTKGL